MTDTTESTTVVTDTLFEYDLTKPQSAEQTGLRYFKPGDIITDPSNVRAELTGIEELAESIFGIGLITPPTVRSNGDGKAHIVAGHRRMAAIELLISQGRWTGDVPAFVRLDEDDVSSKVAQLVENIQRVDLNAAEEALAVQQLVVTHGFSIDDVALNTGRSLEWSKSRFALTKLSDAGMDMLRRGALLIGAAQELAKATPKAQDSIVKKLDPNDAHAFANRQANITQLVNNSFASAFRAEIKAVLKNWGFTGEIVKGLSYNQRTTEKIDVTPSTLNTLHTWLVSNNLTDDAGVKITLERNWSQVSYHLAVVVDKAQPATAAGSGTPGSLVGPYEPNPPAADDYDEEFYPEEVKQWWAKCVEVWPAIQQDESAARELHRRRTLAFVQTVDKAQVAAAALRYVALDSIWLTRRLLNDPQYADHRNRPGVLAVLGEGALGLEADELTEYITSDPKRVIRLAALNLDDKQGTLDKARADWDEAHPLADDELAVPTWPEPPQLVKDYLDNAEGTTWEEWVNHENGTSIDDIADRIMEGLEYYLRDLAAEAAQPSEDDDGPSDEELAAIENGEG